MNIEKLSSAILDLVWRVMQQVIYPPVQTVSLDSYSLKSSIGLLGKHNVLREEGTPVQTLRIVTLILQING